MSFLSLVLRSQQGSSRATGSDEPTQNSNTTRATSQGSTFYGNLGSQPSCASPWEAAPLSPQQTLPLVAEAAVQKLLGRDHFSICSLDNLMELVGAKPSTQAYRQLRALHCVDYASMRPELLAQIPHLINQALTGCVTQAKSTITLRAPFTEVANAHAISPKTSPHLKPPPSRKASHDYTTAGGKKLLNVQCGAPQQLASFYPLWALRCHASG